MSLLGSLGGAALSLGSNMASAFQAQSASRHMTSTQNRRAQYMYKNRYKWTMEDMKRSGLNPILAATGGFNVGSGPQIASAQSFQAPASQSLSSTALDFAKTEQSGAETEKIAEETDKIHSEINLILRQIIKTDTENKQVVQNINNLLMQYQKIGQEITSLEQKNERNAVMLKYIRKTEQNLDSLIDTLQTGQSWLQPKLKNLWEELKNEIHRGIQ